MFFQLVKISNILLPIILIAQQSAFAHPDIDDRIEEVNQAIARSADNAELFIKRGSLYFNHHELNNAIKDYDRALAIDPESCPALFGKAQIAVLRKSFKEADRVLNACHDSAVYKNQIRRLQAEVLAESGQYDQAASLLEQLISDLPEVSPELLLTQAEVLIKAGKSEEALAKLNKALSGNDQIPALTEKALSLEISLGKTDQALARIDTNITESARKEDWYLKKAKLELSSGRKDQALKSAQSGIDFINNLPAAVQQQKVTQNTLNELKAIMR